jgi:Protein of unknown function (DUF3224)
MVLARAEAVLTLRVRLPVGAPLPQGAHRMTFQATGTFEVTMTPQGTPEPEPGATLARMSLDKTFSGDLSGVGRGEMLTAMTPTAGSAGYVALERVTGALQGRKGSFVFQHAGIMNRGQPQLSVTVVPDSGTDELAGLAGRFSIDHTDGLHRYVFDYTLP